ncbi:MAG TPA: exonuclease domain-containing protein [Saprospiraceae bacterium]|nr:exonuclease domain-containing protein [Saprospiraceae bacterium]
MKPKIYAVVDIETTGGMARRDRITEIAIALYDGEKIIDSFQSLVNPERSIPTEITRITGITNSMVANAPKFYEVAKQVVELTEGAIFVAHNVRFDYSFIREEFAALGFTFIRKQLCTVVLSRKAFPGLRSYSLGNLIRHFDIKVENRHRAMDDVLATVNVLGRILSQEGGVHQVDRIINAGIKASHLPKDISMERIHSLPESTGVYYFYNEYGHVIYVGKSINIRKRIMQHFGNIDDKTDKFIKKVADITYEETGNELVAMLLESSEIKALQPEINKAQRTKDYPYFIHHYVDEKGYIRFDWDKSSVKSRQNKSILNHYGSKGSARGHLMMITEQLGLCSGLTGLYESVGSCFYYQTGACSGACQHIETPESYNERATEAIEYLQRSFTDNFFLITDGKSNEEKAIVLIEDGHYRGYGYLSMDDLNQGVEEWKEAIKYMSPNPECNQIVMTWMEKHPLTKVVKF